MPQVNFIPKKLSMKSENRYAHACKAIGLLTIHYEKKLVYTLIHEKESSK